MGSVAFDLDGVVTIDNTAPYTAPVPGLGEYTLTITPYSGPDGMGIAGVSLTHTLNVTGTGNVPPISDAGPDQNVNDSDDSGSESITLDGSASSDSDGTITSYVWTENSTQIATGATPTVDLAVGTHTITLTVTDDDGLMSTDEVMITVVPLLYEYLRAELRDPRIPALETA